jgi:hypothetical protein
MKRYIEQLIKDLEEIAKNSPSPFFIEPPPHLDSSPITSELALVPYKTIEELTGFDADNFPLIIDLSGDQTEIVNKAIFQVFESLHIELIDMPENIPREWLYEVLTTNWDVQVQYLPSSGFDLELCTYNWKTCPYGEYCNCYKEKNASSDNDIPFIKNDLIDDSELPF